MTHTTLAPWMQRLGLRHPIIQAPMTGTATPQLAAAVSNAGALGSIGLGAYSLEKSKTDIEHTHSLTSGPFNVNLFYHQHPQADAAVEVAEPLAERGAAGHRELTLPAEGVEQLAVDESLEQRVLGAHRQ